LLKKSGLEKMESRNDLDVHCVHTVLVKEPFETITIEKQLDGRVCELDDEESKLRLLSLEYPAVCSAHKVARFVASPDACAAAPVRLRRTEKGIAPFFARATSTSGRSTHVSPSLRRA
jgi:hypothetical protein